MRKIIILLFMISITPGRTSSMLEHSYCDEDLLRLSLSNYRPASLLNFKRDEITLATRCANMAYKIIEQEGVVNAKTKAFDEFLTGCRAQGATVTTFEGETGHGPSNYWVTRSRLGFILETEHSIIVAFRGSALGSDYLTDLAVWKTCFHGVEFGYVHSGFNHAFFSLAPQLHEQIMPALQNGKRKLLFTGHSMGGALAHLAALYFAIEAKAYGILRTEIKLVTYNSPRVGNPFFANMLEEQLGLSNIARFTHGEREIASMLAFGTFGFKHAGTNVVVPGGSATSLRGHRMSNFLNGAAEAAFAAHNLEPKKYNGVKSQISIHRNTLYWHLMNMQATTRNAMTNRAITITGKFWRMLGY